MALANPAFTRNTAFSSQAATAQNLTAEQLQRLYEQPATLPDSDVMTVENTIQKTAAAFAVLLVGAAISWFVAPVAPWVFWVGSLVGFVLALVNIFKREPSPALILAYSGAQGLFVGGISRIYEGVFTGIVAQAVIATIVVFGVTLALFASGKVRASAKATKVFLIAMVGYLVFSLVNVVLVWTGVNHDPWGLLTGVKIFGIPLGIVIGILVVIMAAYSLVLDFDQIQQGVRNRAPKKYGWTGAFGIMVTVIWLYLELLRFIGIARN